MDSVCIYIGMMNIVVVFFKSFELGLVCMFDLSLNLVDRIMFKVN